MGSGLRWKWRREQHYRTSLIKLAGERGKFIQELPSPPFQPIKIYFSDALVASILRSPEPTTFTLAEAARAVPRQLELFLGRFAGADFDRTLLMDTIELPIQARQGSSVRMPVILGWWKGHVSLLKSGEIELDEEFYTDRILFSTELNYRCRDEE